MKLNLGCGSAPLRDHVNVDISPDVGADVVHDLDTGPWPFPDDCCESIAAQDVFEHLANPILFMTECHRVLKAGGLLLIKSPHWKHRDAYTDPTHRRFCTEFTWDYWIAGTDLHRLHGRAYGGHTAQYQKNAQDIDHGAIYTLLEKI